VKFFCGKKKFILKAPFIKKKYLSDEAFERDGKEKKELDQIKK